MRVHIRLGFSFIASLCLCATSVSAQANPDAVVQGLRSTDRAEQLRALRALRGAAPEDIGPVVRQALIEATMRENRVGAARMERTLSGTTRPSDNIEDLLILDLVEVVAGLRDPATVSVLLGAFEAGVGAYALYQTLAEFGEPAARQIVDAVMDPDSSPYLVNGGLPSLRLLVERSPSLSAPTIEAITLAAERYLTDPGVLGVSILREAINLATVLSDPRLDDILRALASDPAAVEARGIEGSNWIEGIQALAQQALARVPPLPRPR